jgi:membrane protease YdiL (CAAX protease family)
MPLVLLLLGLYLFGIHSPANGIPILIAVAAVTILSLLLKELQAFHVGLLGGLMLACIFISPFAAAWPLSAVGAVGVYAGIVMMSPRFRQSAGWVRGGSLRRANLILTGLTGFIGFGLVMGWVGLVRPDLSGQAASVPEASVLVLILLGLAFTVMNSFAEEVLFRGVIMHALEKAFSRSGVVLVLQALVFGLVHVRGFPSGVFGMIVAAVVGLGFGYLRMKTKGMFAPWIAHAIVNVLMYGYLVSLAR